MKTYSFGVVIEPVDDRWHAYCPALEKYGASSWGNTKEEALKLIGEAIQKIVGELVKGGKAIPEEPKEEIGALTGSTITVTMYEFTLDDSEIQPEHILKDLL